MAHFILSFYLVLSASAFVLTNQYELKFSSIGAERERERGNVKKSNVRNERIGGIFF